MAKDGVEVKGLKQIQKDLSRLRKVYPLQIREVNRIAEIFKADIKDRTLKGKDVDGNLFAPYSESYALKRQEAGRPTNLVDLFWFGHMFAAMAHKATTDSIRIYFRTVKEGLKADGLHFGNPTTGLPSRRFFDISDDELDKAMDYIERLYRG